MKAACGRTARAVWAADGGQREGDRARLLRPDKTEQIAEQPGEEFHRNLLYTEEQISGPENHQTRARQAHIDGKEFNLAAEIEYIQRRAAEHDGRFVTVGPLALFSTDTGDAWLLDAEDHLVARLARDGDPEEIHFEETDTRFAVDWKGNTLEKTAVRPRVPFRTPAVRKAFCFQQLPVEARAVLFRPAGVDDGRERNAQGSPNFPPAFAL